MKLYHFSSSLPAHGGVLDPKRLGQNPWTKGDAREVTIPRVYFYIDPKQREAIFTKKSPIFEADVPDDKIYDIDADPKNFKRPGMTATYLISKIASKYHGLKYGNVVALFRKIAVKPSKVKLAREDVEAHAREYHTLHKDIFGLDRSMDHPAPTWNPDLSRRAAEAFERAKHTPNNRKVRQAYDQLAKEIEAQYQFLVNKGVKFEPWTGEGQPYANSKAMTEDVYQNGHLWYFPSDRGQGQGEVGTPSLTPEINDKFRAVHDYFGHAIRGHQFGPKGELQAWSEHAKMFSPLARAALTVETHGQNSWVNFGPHSHLPVTERPYAAQKATLLPKNVVPLSRFGVPPVADVRRPANARHVYAWVKPDGEVIHVPDSHRHHDVAVAHGFSSADDAMQGGWLRVSSAGAVLDGANFLRAPNMKQLRALKDLAIQSQYESASVNDRPLRLSRKPTMGLEPQGWIAPDGQFHPNLDQRLPNQHEKTVKALGFRDGKHAFDEGWAHVAKTFKGNHIYIHHPSREYTPLQLSTFRRLGKQYDMSMWMSATSNGQPVTRELKLARSIVYVSPSEREGSTMDQAAAAFGSPEHQALLTDAEQLGGQATPAMGTWIDGAEESAAISADRSLAAKLAAILGKKYKQKGVAIFHPGDGSDTLDLIYLKGHDPITADKALKDVGIQFATHVPVKGGVLVHVIGADEGAVRSLNAKYKRLTGTAEFPGADTREDAAKVFDRMLLSRDDGPEGWITPEGVFHQNDMSLPFGSRHEATLMAHDLKHGEAVRLGWMHVGSPDDVQVLGHHPDLAYTAPQLRTLKKLAAKSNRTPAITSKSNGVYTTRELKLAREDIAALKGLVAQAPSDPQAHLMLAEALEAHGHPRLAGLLMHPGGMWTPYMWSSSYRQGLREHKGARLRIRGSLTHPLVEGIRIYPGSYRGTRHLGILFHHAPGLVYRVQSYPIREYKSAEDEMVNLSRRELSGWVSPTGEFTENTGESTHGDTAYILLTQKHGHPEDVRNVEQLLHREGYMHVSDGEDGILYGHHPDRQYQASQLLTLKRLARENGFTKAAVTNDINGRLGTRELQLSMEKPEHLGDPVPEDKRFEESIRFTVPGSGTYDVALSKPSPWSKKRDLVFDRVDRDGPPPQNPNKVFAHVAHGALQLLRKHNRHPVVIEAGSPGLVKLYERLMDRLPDHLPGWAVSRGMDEGGGYGVWQLTPPSLKLGALRRMEGYNGWVDPEGQFYLNPENGTADHEFGARRIVPHGQDLPWASDHLESKGWMKVWAWKHLPELLYGHHPKYQYTSAQVSALKRLARKGGFTTVSITTKVNGSPGTRELKLARQKAPAGGMIVNNQFFKGGKFLPRALESIRKMRGHIALARVPLPEGAFGQKTLTDAQIRDIENHHGLEEHERLPRTVNPDGTVSTSIEHLAPFFDRLAKKAIGPERHAAILADDGVSDDVKFYHLLTHAHDSANDYLSAVARSGTEWYGSSVAQLDRGLKVIFGRERPGDPTSKPDPKKWTPAHAKLFKMLLALTSYNTAPINNTKNAIAALLAGYRHGPHAPFENIPDANHESLAPYKDLPPPGTAISDRLKWQEKYGEKKNPGYMSAPVRLANGKVVGLVNMDSTVRWLAPGFDKTNTKPGLIPITDETGALRPKTWGSMGVDRVRKFKEFISRAGSYQKAARILEREWTPAQLKQMFNLKAINRGDLEPGAKIPGSFAFGPKFGAFFQNLRGEKSRIAMDKWYSRTMARLVGNLIGNGKLVEIPDGPRTRRLWKRVGEAVAKRLGIPPADMQAVLWYYEQNLWRLFGAKNQSEDFADGIRQALKTHGFTK